MDNVLRCGKESGLPSAPVTYGADDFQTLFQSKILSVLQPSTLRQQQLRRLQWVCVPGTAHLNWRSPASLPYDLPGGHHWWGPPYSHGCSSNVMLSRVSNQFQLFFLRQYVVSPLLQKVSTDPQDLKHYKPVFNLSFPFEVGLQSGRQAADCRFGDQPTFAAVAVSPQTPPFYRDRATQGCRTSRQRPTIWGYSSCLVGHAAFDCVDHDHDQPVQAVVQLWFWRCRAATDTVILIRQKSARLFWRSSVVSNRSDEDQSLFQYKKR